MKNELKTSRGMLRIFLRSPLQFVSIIFFIFGSLASAFYVGVLSEFDTQFFLLINKANVLDILVNFFVLFFVFIAFIYYSLMVMINSYPLTKTKFDNVIKYRLFVVVVIFVICGSYLALLLSNFKIDTDQFIQMIIPIIFSLILIYIAFRPLRVFKCKELNKRMKNYAFYAGYLLLLTSALFGGKGWVQYQKTSPRSIDIFFKKTSKPDSGNILFSGNRGIMVFLKGKDKPSYILWDVIEKIELISDKKIKDLKFKK